MKKNEIKDLRITDYNYDLPDGRIARYPLPERDSSKLLLYRNGDISAEKFNDISRFIPENSLMIFNDTRVIHARLIFRKSSGAHIEVFCLSPFQPADYAINFSQREKCSWNCMVGNAKRWKGEVLQMEIFIHGVRVTLFARKIKKIDADTVVGFSWDNAQFTFSELLEIAGKLPIPPYLNRASVEADDTTYQTVYSKVEGSVAAPTAGLHFTPAVTESLTKKGIFIAHVTLHVGAGTFKPVKSETISGHDMHAEFISVSRETIESIIENSNPLVVVGTTSMRTIESLYYIGKKIHENPDIHSSDLAVAQWEPYRESKDITPKQALKAIIGYLEKNNETTLITSTQIIILPGYRFHFADGIVTNFHQPQSTLLLLISAFVGAKWKEIYDFALQNDFRFLSYGDSSLLWKTHTH